VKEKIETERAPQAIGPYSQAIRTGNLIFASGQVALDPRSGQLLEGGVKEQTSQAIRNLAAVLEAAGSDLEHVVKTTVFLIDMGDFAAMNEVYGTFFGGIAPARATVAAAGLPKNARVEIEAIAVRKES
jgi:2-iminobutanoate/2-iminopropanoate deaminase